MHIYLPVAVLSTSFLLVVAVGVMVGFLSGLVGVGGGFLLTPILMMIGVPPTIAAASGTCALVGTSSSATAAHFRLGHVDLKLGTILLLGGLAGAAIGVRVIKALRALGNADLV
ncbi:MAG TPA: TSUP family transporter, partial [Terracidiphilus sp.]|nr:TSUP family transporter [Terracidiphilus sp.]